MAIMAFSHGFFRYFYEFFSKDLLGLNSGLRCKKYAFNLIVTQFLEYQL